MARIFPDVRRAVAASVFAAVLNAGIAQAQEGDLAPPVLDVGGIDGDLAGRPAPAPTVRYAPGVLEAYQQQLQAYRQRLAAIESEQAARAELFRRQQEIYRREQAAAKAARRKYEADRVAWEAAMARRR